MEMRDDLAADCPWFVVVAVVVVVVVCYLFVCLFVCFCIAKSRQQTAFFFVQTFTAALQFQNLPFLGITCTLTEMLLMPIVILIC